MQQEENNKELIKILEIKKFQGQQNPESGLHLTKSAFHHLAEIEEKIYSVSIKEAIGI